MFHLYLNVECVENGLTVIWTLFAWWFLIFDCLFCTTCVLPVIDGWSVDAPTTSYGPTGGNPGMNDLNLMMPDDFQFDMFEPPMSYPPATWSSEAVADGSDERRIGVMIGHKTLPSSSPKCNGHSKYLKQFQLVLPYLLLSMNCV